MLFNIQGVQQLSCSTVKVFNTQAVQQSRCSTVKVFNSQGVQQSSFLAFSSSTVMLLNILAVQQSSCLTTKLFLQLFTCKALGLFDCRAVQLSTVPLSRNFFVLSLFCVLMFVWLRMQWSDS
jgi:hypothetical protein